jgi:hypothetical protein
VHRVRALFISVVHSANLEIQTPMNKTNIIIIAIVAVACVATFYALQSDNRYCVVIGAEKVAYEVDKKTGESWVLSGANKVKQEGDAKCNKDEDDF